MANTRVLVIGGGLAGITAAVELGRMGVPVEIVEKSAYLGGKTVKYGCKATDKCQKCGVCLVSDKMEELGRTPGLGFHVRAEVVSLRGEPGAFLARVCQAPLYIDPALCTGCGLCAQWCSERGCDCVKPLPGGGVPPTYTMEPCQGHSLEDLAKVCPFGAINPRAQAREYDIEAGAVIVATGFRAFDPSVLPNLGYGRVPQVYTGLEMEEILRAHSTLLMPDGSQPGRVAFIQCVGSRNVQLGSNYCSEVCCRYGLRMALHLKSEMPQCEVSVLYMDLQTAAKGAGDLYQEASRNLRLIQGMPGEVKAAGGKVKVGYEDVRAAHVVWEEFDAVVLSVGVWPGDDTEFLAQRLGINKDVHGFFGQDGSPWSTRRPGVFLAGTCTGPMAIPDTQAHARGAAKAVISLLGVEVT